MVEYGRTLKLTADGDIALGNQKRGVMLSPVQTVEQELKVLIQTIAGEDVFDERHGLRLFDALGSPDSVLEREIRFALQRDDRVEEVRDVEITEDDKHRRRDVAVSVLLVEDESLEFGVTFNE